LLLIQGRQIRDWRRCDWLQPPWLDVCAGKESRDYMAACTLNRNAPLHLVCMHASRRNYGAVLVCSFAHPSPICSCMHLLLSLFCLSSLSLSSLTPSPLSTVCFLLPFPPPPLLSSRLALLGHPRLITHPSPRSSLHDSKGHSLKLALCPSLSFSSPSLSCLSLCSLPFLHTLSLSSQTTPPPTTQTKKKKNKKKTIKI